MGLRMDGWMAGWLDGWMAGCVGRICSIADFVS